MLRVAVVLLLAACASDPAACKQSIAAYCANSNCPLTWDAAQDPAAWGCGSGNHPNVTVGVCGDVRVASIGKQANTLYS